MNRTEEILKELGDHQNWSTGKHIIAHYLASLEARVEALEPYEPALTYEETDALFRGNYEGPKEPASWEAGDKNWKNEQLKQIYEAFVSGQISQDEVRVRLSILDQITNK